MQLGNCDKHCVSINIVLQKLLIQCAKTSVFVTLQPRIQVVAENVERMLSVRRQEVVVSIVSVNMVTKATATHAQVSIKSFFLP